MSRPRKTDSWAPCWQAVPVGEINIPVSVMLELTERGLRNFGDVAAHIEAGNRLEHLPGVTPLVAKKIRVAIGKARAKR